MPSKLTIYSANRLDRAGVLALAAAVTRSRVVAVVVERLWVAGVVGRYGIEQSGAATGQQWHVCLTCTVVNVQQYRWVHSA